MIENKTTYFYTYKLI